MTEFYYNASWQVVETRCDWMVEDTGSEWPVSTEPESQFVWSLRYMDAPVLRDRSADHNDGTVSDSATGRAGSSRSWTAPRATP